MLQDPYPIASTVIQVQSIGLLYEMYLNDHCVSNSPHISKTHISHISSILNNCEEILWVYENV